MADSILPVPANLKPCQTYLKLAADHEKLNPTLTYWCRLYALQLGLKIDSKSKENRDFLMSVMDWLEKEKKSKENDEKYTNELVAQAHVENYGMKIFLKADADDRAGTATKNTAKQFFTAAQIFDMSAVFGELSDDLAQKSKYAKWRAAYIIKCVKSGEKPLPPEEEMKSNEDDQSNNQTSNDQNFDIGQPPELPKFSLNEINNLTIDNRPSSTPSHTNTDSSNQSTISSTNTGTNSKLTAINGIQISQDDILKAQKYCKWASSALDYEDVRTAVSNLEKSLNILTKGSEI